MGYEQYLSNSLATHYNISMRILSFGHIPSWAGGKQESGLANVIYSQALHIAEQADVEMFLAATDTSVEKQKHGQLTIIGWQKSKLLVFALLHLVVAFRFLWHLCICKMKYHNFVSLLGMFFKGMFLYRTIKFLDPHIVHLHAAHSIVYLPLIKEAKIVLTHHGMVGGDAAIKHSDIYSKLEDESCKSDKISVLYFIAKRLVADFEKRYGAIIPQTQVITNAFDGSAFNYIVPEPHEVLTLCPVASFSENKGQKRVIEGIAKSGIPCQYFCIGGAKEEEIKEYKAYAKARNVSFTYLGKQAPTKIREFLAKADFMILPSSTEGFGLVYLEAIACGVPVILPTHLPIVAEDNIIKPGINAILLNDSSAEAIAQTIHLLPTMTFDRENVAKTVLTFTWKEVAQQYVYSFKQIL